MKGVNNRCYRFENVEIDVQNLRVTVGSEIRPLEPKSFRLLLFLVENPGRVLPKDEIISSVWSDIAVSDNSLTRAITQVRKALDDDPKAPKYIETVPTIGYRFLGDCKADQNLSGASDATGNGPAHVLAPVSATTRARVRPYRWAAIAGAAAVVIGLSVGGWLFYSRKAHRLTDKDTIVLADFTNSTGDPVFDDALRQGLATQLGQSPFLNILPEQKLRSALKEMTRSPDEALTAAVTQEACVRIGGRAYIVGSIANLGGHYVIGLNAINCSTGDVLAREQGEAGDKQQVLAALGSVAEKLRNKLGESLSSIQQFDVPLAQATTSSLEALRAYSLALSKYAKGDPASAILLFRQAIDLDSNFAMAYANLGRAHQLLGQDRLMDEALRTAFALRNRASEREKFDISAVYYQFITHQTEETIQTCELWQRTYPRDFTPHRILGYENAVLGNYEKSAEEFRIAKELDPSQALPYAGLMSGNMALGRLSDARAVYEEARARKLDAGELVRIRYVLAFLQDDKETMAQTLESLGRRPGFERIALDEQFGTDAYFGRLRKARELGRRMRDLASREDDKDELAEIEAHLAFLEVLFGNSAEARRHATASLGFGEAQPAMALALLGDISQTRKLVDKMSSHAAPGGFINGLWLPELQAAIELKRGNPMRAVELLEPLTAYEGGWTDRYMSAYLRGESYLAAHRGQEAAAEFQKIIDHQGVALNYLIGALARLGVARSYALEGDTAKAGAAYQDFLTLWKDADPDIPVLIAAKSEYAKLK
jgi:DNA-binding winged helix-turn-helix (wHTH) protein/tetratricopeptide (TPR) repeat protein